MKPEISIENRIKASNNIIGFFRAQKRTNNWTEYQLIMRVYNEAIIDVKSAIDTYIEHNPQHALSLRALKEELYWMPLIGEAN